MLTNESSTSCWPMSAAHRADQLEPYTLHHAGWLKYSIMQSPPEKCLNHSANTCNLRACVRVPAKWGGGGVSDHIGEDGRYVTSQEEDGKTTIEKTGLWDTKKPPPCYTLFEMEMLRWLLYMSALSLSASFFIWALSLSFSAFFFIWALSLSNSFFHELFLCFCISFISFLASSSSGALSLCLFRFISAISLSFFLWALSLFFLALSLFLFMSSISLSFF